MIKITDEEEKRLPRNKSLRTLSTNLRNNATPQENKLWYEFLRTYPVRFNRQRIVGNYILDFYCAKARVAVELDGSQHYETKGDNLDKKRTEYLESFDIFVLRFSNLEINEREIDENIKYILLGEKNDG